MILAKVAAAPESAQPKPAVPPSPSAAAAQAGPTAEALEEARVRLLSNAARVPFKEDIVFAAGCPVRLAAGNERTEADPRASTLATAAPRNQKPSSRGLV